MKKIAIMGASGHGKVVADLAELCGFEVVFFDDAFPEKNCLEHWPIKGRFSDLLKLQFEFEYAIVAIGNNQIRINLGKRLIDSGFEPPVLIHPSAVISRYAKIAPGTVVFANSVINSFASIGKDCIINTAVIVEHDCILGDGIHLSPNVSLAGGTVIHDLAWIGIGSVTRQLIQIGKNSTIGANSTVIKDVPAGTTVFGSPADVKSVKC